MNKEITATKFFNLGCFLQNQLLPELLKKFRQHHHHIVIQYIAKLVTLFYRGVTWLNPNLAEAYYRLGQLFQKQQKWLKAATTFEQATKSGCVKLADAYFNLGKILFILKQFEESVRALHQAIKLEPEKFLFYQLLGNTLSEKGELSQAIKNYQIASQKKISLTHPHVVLKSQKEQHLSTPNFLIIGQVKCGTSSLYSYLTQHPQILPAIKKEIHFWNNNFNKGIDWYLAHFPSIDSEQNLITGEATPNYLESQKVAKSLFQEFPNIKLIVLFRNPVDRAISQYYMFVRKGKEKHSVEKAILSEIESITRKSNINSLNNFNISSYIKRSQYIEHLSQWMEIFPRNQFLIVKSEDLFANPETTVDEVFEFLGVESYQLPTYPKVNEGKYPLISQSMRQTMNDYFRPFNQQLEEYLERKFNWY